MPYDMTYYPEAIVLDDKVYVGAGSSFSGLNKVVMVYDIPNDDWGVLPEYTYYWFGMTSMNKSLVLVGGVDTKSFSRTNELGIWDEKEQKWTHTLPPMPTARSGPTVLTYKDQWMIVAGGYSILTNSLFSKFHSTVEILDITKGYWFKASSLPVEQYKMSSTIIGNMWYLLGGFCSDHESEHCDQSVCICVCIDELIYQAVCPTSYSRPPLWRSLPDIPVLKCTALGLRGALLAIGGVDCSSIHLYKPSTNQWIRIGKLSSMIQVCACTLLPNGEVLIVGGAIHKEMVVQSTELVQIGTLRF